MNAKYFKGMIILSVALTFIISGCAGMQGQGRLDNASSGGDGVTIQSLTNDWQDYDIYFSGFYAENATSVVFDRKSDAKGIRLTGTGWTKIGDDGTLRAAVNSIMVNADFTPRVWNVVGPENDSHGYIYTGWKLVTVRAVDQNTVSINGIPAVAEKKHQF